MKITTILKDLFLALASTLLFGGGIGFLGVWIFDAKISTMIHISVYRDCRLILSVVDS